MISVLRRISASASASPFLKLMNNSPPPPPPSQRLVGLAQQLRLYKPPPSFDDAEEQRIEEAAGKVVSQVGFPESATPIARDPERFTPKRAAVLICLFEGDDGELRVILTKRSSRLSTHSGEVSLPGGKAEEGDKDDGDTATREAKEEIGLDPSLVNVVTILEPFLSKEKGGCWFLHEIMVSSMCGLQWYSSYRVFLDQNDRRTSSSTMLYTGIVYDHCLPSVIVDFTQ
ncbi:nudix hydrolase 15, mitochondrial-like isoform X3 [Rhodamnia argentea]|uniref:Nudix hydrolase 15, mitochondrial-like isoform X3 n=1 Tax=Rhodamnia argentea TaxID=178133 RepID=A0ABM3H8D8_9MYRT|nr:nudix hydrolase 15, mitochondrial-like isoform X3 [Rhodamnia argentea]